MTPENHIVRTQTRCWHCHHWHLTSSSQNAVVQPNCCFTGSHDRITFRYSESSSHDKLHHWNLRSRCAVVRVAGDTTFVWIKIFTSVRKRLHTLLSYPALGEAQGIGWDTRANIQWVRFRTYCGISSWWKVFFFPIFFFSLWGIYSCNMHPLITISTFTHSFTLLC